MNFTPEMLAKVLDGTKTQTRRPVKQGDKKDTIERYLAVSYHARWYGGEDIQAVIRSERILWGKGKTYAVCPGRGKKAVARMKITKIRAECPIDISDADARAEGFESREAFWDKLRSLYGTNVNLTAPYWALTFELVKGE